MEQGTWYRVHGPWPNDHLQAMFDQCLTCLAMFLNNFIAISACHQQIIIDEQCFATWPAKQ